MRTTRLLSAAALAIGLVAASPFGYWDPLPTFEPWCTTSEEKTYCYTADKRTVTEEAAAKSTEIDRMIITTQHEPTGTHLVAINTLATATETTTDDTSSLATPAFLEQDSVFPRVLKYCFGPE
ncbi:MAG: hypothetical protein MMC23_007295 [Stictis urceolatum]|nr:hypothetical protein [Stictis urceolata]